MSTKEERSITVTSQLKGAKLLHRQIIALRKGEGIPGVEFEEQGDDLFTVNICLTGPEGCPYEGGRFSIRLTFTDDYPQTPPKGIFTTSIFHPNVSPNNGDICVSSLQKDWQPSLGIAHLLLALKSLLMNPNPESALNEAAGKLLLEDYDAFMRRAALMAQIHAGAPVKNAIVRNESPNGKESRVQLSRKTLPMESVDALLNPLAPHSLLNLSVKRKRRL